MIRNLTLALSSFTLCSTLAFAGNPEAEGSRSSKRTPKRVEKTVKADAILVKRDNEGIKQFYKITKPMSAKVLAAKIEILQEKGEADGILPLHRDALGMSASKSGNAEAEQATAKTAWFGHHHGGGYYGGLWPQTYFYNPGYYAGYGYGGYGYGYNNFGYNNGFGYGAYYPYTYGWSYGCNNFTYGVYWR